MIQLLTAPMFGTKHILGLLYVVILVVVGIKLLGNNPTKRKILIITILFYVFEGLKLGYMIYRDGSYPMNHIPLHLCSMPLYIWPILYFSKKDSKLEKYALATAFTIVLGATLAALLNPGNIIGSNESWLPLTDNYLPWVSFTYHGLMLMSSFYLLTSKLYIPEYLDALRSLVFTFGLMIIALIVSFTIDQDYMLLHTGNGSPLKPVLDNSGQFVYTTLMIVVGLFVIGLISFISTFIYKLIKRGK
ncbi:Integral membrane protein [Candidatus Izimaplasma bacterium HR1]|jgi:hypothetical protein|uniref:TMEM164 family acyltransferase n=1 Tax=Candidatus Izimoplasma sp. HR1 TaxID=1541959 RepID=UPI0004F5DD72|nr:Integral membrane protein [Candidatus Izimaplasma bacterium HR1]